MVLQLLLSVSFAVLISAICSLFEAVLYSVPLRHVESMIENQRFGGKTFRALRRNVDRPIAAILSLNTVAHTVGAAFAGAAATAVFGEQWLGYFSAVFTLVILIFSEIIPKTAGVVYGRGLVGPVAYALKGMVWIMAPVIWLTGLVTRLIGRNPSEDAVTAEEIQVMARLSRRTGGIRLFQEQAIERVLTLQEKYVREVMTPRTVVFSLNQGLSVSEAVNTAGRLEHSRIPVFDQSPEDVVGIVHTRDILIALARGRNDQSLARLMRPIHFVAEAAPLNTVLNEFLELKQHLFAVSDEYGGLAGIIALEDILEEILGREIVDESDLVADKQQLARKRRAPSANVN